MMQVLATVFNMLNFSTSISLELDFDEIGVVVNERSDDYIAEINTKPHAVSSIPAQLIAL